jgi:hypothetical protein
VKCGSNTVGYDLSLVSATNSEMLTTSKPEPLALLIGKYLPG